MHLGRTRMNFMRAVTGASLAAAVTGTSLMTGLGTSANAASQRPATQARLTAATQEPARGATGGQGANRPADGQCGWVPLTDNPTPSSFTASGVRIRTGPSTACTAKGHGYPADELIAYCYYGTGQDAWFYVSDTTTRVNGWVLGLYVSLGSDIGACMDSSENAVP